MKQTILILVCLETTLILNLNAIPSPRLELLSSQFSYNGIISFSPYRGHLSHKLYAKIHPSHLVIPTLNMQLHSNSD